MEFRIKIFSLSYIITPISEALVVLHAYCPLVESLFCFVMFSSEQFPDYCLVLLIKPRAFTIIVHNKCACYVVSPGLNKCKVNFAAFVNRFKTKNDTVPASHNTTLSEEIISKRSLAPISHPPSPPPHPHLPRPNRGRECWELCVVVVFTHPAS